MNETRIVELGRPDAVTVAGLIAIFMFSYPKPPGWVTREFGSGREYALVLVILWFLAMSIWYRHLLLSFSPDTKLEVRIFNEQIKSISTFLNSLTIAVAAVLGFSVLNLSSDWRSASEAIMMLTLAFMLHTWSRRILSLLKSEEV